MAHQYTHELQVRFRDLDTMAHVNNAVYASYLEQARVGYFREVVGERLESVSTVLARYEIDFRRPITVDDAVTVAVDAATLGSSSITLEYDVRAADGDGTDRLAATASTVSVLVDPETGDAQPLPEAWRERIEG